MAVNFYGIESKLRESADSPGLIDVHIIAPGWGSWYYSESLLRDAVENRVYHAGMQMNWDHQTESEEMERPERSLSKLAGVLTQDAWYDPNGWDGPGIYSTAKPMPAYVEAIRAMGPHIGISHNVYGDWEWGEAEGREGKIATVVYADDFNTVDFVTLPGAGGHYRTVFAEAAKLTEAFIPSNPSDYGKDPENAAWDAPNLKAFTDKNWADLTDTEKRNIAKHFAYADNLDTFTALKFPHHNPKNGNVVWRAVANAMARLNQSNISADMKDRVKAHLVKHYPDFGKEYQESLEGGDNVVDKITLAEVEKDEKLMEAIRAKILKESDNEKLSESLKAEQKTNKELKESLGKATAELLVQKGRTYALAKVAESELPAPSQKRVVESPAFGEIPAKDGEIDTKEFDKAIETAIKTETDYIESVLKESGAGGVHDLGKNGGSPPATVEANKEAYRDSLVETGTPRAQANKMAGIKE
jgi:hypothetical protein